MSLLACRPSTPSTGKRHSCHAEDERRTLTSKSFAHIEIGSAWINQTIRNANARTKVKQFRCLPLETNNQNWTLHKVGDTYSVSFGLRRGIKKRVRWPSIMPRISTGWMPC